MQMQIFLANTVGIYTIADQIFLQNCKSCLADRYLKY